MDKLRRDYRYVEIVEQSCEVFTRPKRKLCSHYNLSSTTALNDRTQPKRRFDKPGGDRFKNGEDGSGEETDERLKNIDPKMIEMINNEVCCVVLFVMRCRPSWFLLLIRLWIDARPFHGMILRDWNTPRRLSRKW
jgi:hypothetical protein